MAEAFHEPDPSVVIQPLAEKFRENTQAEFIVVANMSLIRYSHPNLSEIGKPLDGEDSFNDKKVLQGQEIRATAVGSLGLTIRAKTPIYDSNHHQIGLVSVGFLVQDIWNRTYSVLIKIVVIGIGALLFGLGGAYLLSGHIKKQIFNMEPNEIAYISQEQAAILDFIREGIIAVNSDGGNYYLQHGSQKNIGNGKYGLARKKYYFDFAYIPLNGSSSKISCSKR